MQGFAGASDFMERALGPCPGGQEYKEDKSPSANRAFQIVPKCTLAWFPFSSFGSFSMVAFPEEWQAGKSGVFLGWGWKSTECSSGAGIAEEAEASSPAQEAILEQTLNARFQAEFN